MPLSQADVIEILALELLGAVPLDEHAVASTSNGHAGGARRQVARRARVRADRGRLIGLEGDRRARDRRRVICPDRSRARVPRRPARP
jgi:septum formation inhibitor-activating ATPase MinD